MSQLEIRFGTVSYAVFAAKASNECAGFGSLAYTSTVPVKTTFAGPVRVIWLIASPSRWKSTVSRSPPRTSTEIGVA